MLAVVDIEFIRKKHFVEGWSIRKLARQTEWSRPTIRKALQSAEPWTYQRTHPRPRPTMDPYLAIVRQWLTEDQTAPPKQRHTAHRCYTRLVAEHGFAGSESTVRRTVRTLRRELGTVPPAVFLTLRPDPGELAQVD